MIARLAKVVYWTCNTLAAAIAALAIYVGLFTNTAGRELFGVIGVLTAIGALTWLFGRACLYVLAGR